MRTMFHTHVSHKLLQEAYLKALKRGDTTSEICRRIGYVNKNGKPETQRLKRRLGLAGEWSGEWNGRPPTKLYTRSVRKDTALKIAQALNVDPVDVGL